MVQLKKNVFSCATNFLKGRKCIFCGSFKLSKTRRGYIKCSKCFHQKSLKHLRREISIVKGFYQQQPAYRLANDLMIDYQSVTRVYQKLRIAIYHITELEGTKMSGEIEMDEAYDELMAIIQKKTRKGSVYYSDTFKSYNSLKRLGKHLRVNHSKHMVDKILLLTTYFAYVSH